MKIRKNRKKINVKKCLPIPNEKEAQLLISHALSISESKLAGYALTFILNQYRPHEIPQCFDPVNWVECIKWIHLLNFTGMCAQPPGTRARIFYECLANYLCTNAPEEILKVYLPLFLKQNCVWEVKKND